MCDNKMKQMIMSGIIMCVNLTALKLYTLKELRTQNQQTVLETELSTYV